MSRIRTAVLISGRGSNLAALLVAAQAPDFPAAISLVVSDRPDAAGLGRARDHNVLTSVVDRARFADRPSFETVLHSTLQASGVQLICLAGFMRLLSPAFVETWQDRLINIHPSLLPAFRGLDTHGRALAEGVRIHGATVHFVRAEVDQGPIIAQAALAVRNSDTAETLATRVLELEHHLYPRTLARVAARLAGNATPDEEEGWAEPRSLFSPPL